PISSGPSIAPAPKQPCIEVRTPGEKRAAAYALRPASIRPAAAPATRPASIKGHQPGARAKPKALAAYARLLHRSSHPAPTRAAAGPLPRLATRWPPIMTRIRLPKPLTGNAKSRRTDGHATPSAPSGSPRAAKARATIVTGAQRFSRATVWTGYAIADTTRAVSGRP